MDTLSPRERSERMSRVRSKDTKPELAVRRLVFSMGYRYRLHRRDLPGCPDMTFMARRKVIFVHGCFWHRHEGCARTRFPKSRLGFWKTKLLANKARDVVNLQKLKSRGWRSLVVWECEVENVEKLRRRIRRFLG